MPFLAPVLILLAIAWSDGAGVPMLRDWIGDGWAWGLCGLAIFGAPIAGWPVHWFLGRRMDRHGSRAAALASHRVQLVQGLLVTIGGAVAIGAIGLLDLVRSLTGDMVALDEAITGGVCALAWALVCVQTYPIERRHWEVAQVGSIDAGEQVPDVPGCGAWTWLRLRESVLVIAAPGLVMLAWWECTPMLLGWLDTVAPWLGLLGREDGELYATGAGSAVVFVGVAILAAFMARLMAMVLPTVRLRGGSVGEEVVRLCRWAGVRVPVVYLWRPTRGWANAAVMGAIPGARVLLVSEGLIQGLPRAQASAVIAHEVGHLRYRHVLWLAGCLVASLVVADACGALLMGDAGRHLWSEAGAGVVSLGVAGVVLGYVSRRFERQADAFAVRAMAEGGLGAGDAVEAVARALEGVARLNGSRPERWTFTHGSIRDRAARVRRLGPSGVDAGLERWFVLLRVGVLVGIVAGVAILASQSTG